MSNSVNAHGGSTEASPRSRAPADQGAGRGREQGEDLSSGHPIHPPSSTSTREAADQTAAASLAGEQTMDGWPTTATAKAMLRQLDADRERSGYWRSRWAEDHSDQAIEAWLRSLLDWLETAGPVDTPPSARPVELPAGTRSLDAIRTDLATYIDAFNNTEWSREDWLVNVGEAAVGVCESVPQLLAEVEAAHRFEQQWTAELVELASTLNGVAAERDELRAEVERLRGRIGSEAWFGAWECGCTDTETSVGGIPEFCPVHGQKLISNFAGATKVQLTHSGVSGYGFRSGPRSGS